MANVPLSLALEPLLPSRVPIAGCSTLGYGYKLRLPDGPAIEDDDPLLRAYGAAVDWLEFDEGDDEPLQLACFDPGRALRLGPLPGEVAVLDAEGIRCAGAVVGEAGAVACAALEHGLEVEALALSEQREVGDDRRCGLQLLMFSPAFVEVQGRSVPHVRPALTGRRRLVLFADELRWWDPSASGGPVDVYALGLSAELAGAFARLREEYAALAGASVGDVGDLLERKWTGEALDEQARSLWLRARRELGRQYAVGYLGPGMERPIWSAEADDE
jgi:hypothetical protein